MHTLRSCMKAGTPDPELGPGTARSGATYDCSLGRAFSGRQKRLMRDEGNAGNRATEWTRMDGLAAQPADISFCLAAGGYGRGAQRCCTPCTTLPG